MLLTATIFAQDLPRIAVYVTGDIGDNEKRILATSMLTALATSGHYMAAERSNAFLAEIESEWAKLPSGAVMDNNQISELGKRFDIGRVCIASITSAFGEYHISARVIDVETEAIVLIGQSHGPLRTMNDLTSFAEEIVKSILSRQVTRPRSQPIPTIGPVFPTEPAPAVHVYPPQEAVRVRQTQVAEVPPPSIPAPVIPPGVKPNIALYITSSGGSSTTARTITPLVANGLSRALSGSGSFSAANRTNDINRQLGHAQGGGLTEQQMRDVASQLGIHYLCIVKINFGAGGSFGLEVELANAAAGRTVTTINLANLNRNTVATSMVNIGRELLAEMAEMGGAEQVAGQTPVTDDWNGEIIYGADGRFIPAGEPYIDRVATEQGFDGESAKITFYLAPRYILPLTSGVPKWGLGAEMGLIFDNNVYLGIDGGGGGSGGAGNGGFGLTLGGVIDLSDDAQLFLGGFLGYWTEAWIERNWNMWNGRWEREKIRKSGIIGPSIKLRLSVVEFSYRLLVGDGFINQFMAGLHFQ
jgi:hypothetical protein